MASTVEILFVGLCSFLNMDNSVNYMPPPSVIMHRVPTMKHVAFIAWDEAETKLDDAANLPVLRTKKGRPFIMLDAEEISLNDDFSALPTLDATFKNGVARLSKYANLSAVPVFDQRRVPIKGHLPDGAVEQAYLEFGSGTISSDWETEKEFVFRDTKTATPADATPRKYHRRVHYVFPAAANALTVVLRKFDNSAHRRLVFRPVSGTNTRVWIGNSMDIDEDLNPTPPIKNKTAIHFAAFYDTLAVQPAKVFVPVIEGTITPPVGAPPAGGSGTGYCGPDNQP